MKAFLAILAAACLAGCRPPSSAPIDNPTAWRIAAEHGPQAVVLCWSNAVRGASNRAELDARFAIMADKLAVEWLAGQAPGELARRADTIQRGTSRSPYTSNQVWRAQQAKGLK